MASASDRSIVSFGLGWRVRRVVEVYRARTGVVIDEVRLRRAHALAALAQYGWAWRAPDEHHRTGRTPDQTRAWAIEAVARASAVEGKR